MKFREKILKNGIGLLLGKDAKNNDELVKKFKGKPNTILHTSAPGSPFCVIENKLKPTKTELALSGAVCAGYSQVWRENKDNTIVDIFTGKDVFKKKGMKVGTWHVKNSKKMEIKKKDIKKALEYKGQK